jgi:hypothetical protein
MKECKMRYSAIFACAPLAISLVSAISTAAQQDGRVQSIFYVEDSTVCLHEPARFALSLTNLTSTKIAINLGRESSEFITIDTGQPGHPSSSSASLFKGGLSALGVIQLNPGQEKRVSFLVDSWVGNLPVGVYRMRITLHVPPTGQEWDPPSETTLAGELKTEAVFNLKVEESCPAKLMKLAKQDVSTILGDDNVDHQRMAAQHLSFIDDPVAVPYMERAVFPQGLISNREVIDGLARIGDSTAMEALDRLSYIEDLDISSYARSRVSALLRMNKETLK